MNILFISENYYPNFSGVPVVVQYLAEDLVKKGHAVGVLTKKVNNCPDRETINGVKVYRIDVYVNTLKFYKGKIDDFINFVLNYHADIYIFEGATVVTTDILLPYLKKLDGIKILHSHGFSRLILKPFEKLSTIKNTIGNTYNYLRWKPYFKYYLPKYINNFDGVICLSQIDSSYEYLKKIYKNQVNILGNAADDSFFLPSKKTIDKYTCIKGKGYILSVANYDAVKNQIGILQEYYKTNDDYDMVFIGRVKNYYYDALMDENARLAKLYGARNVHILVNVDRKDIPGIYEYAYLYLVASVAEGYSISIIESMAKGVPFISTDVGNASLLPGGIVVQKVSDIAKKVDMLINDKQLYQELSSKAKQYAFSECRIQSSSSKLLNYVEIAGKSK